MQEVIRTLDATRAEQQELYLKEENEDELVQLRLQNQRTHGDGQTCGGLPNSSVVQSLLHGGSQTGPTQGVQQQGVPSQSDHQAQFEQAFEHFKRTGCVPVPNVAVLVSNMSAPYVPGRLSVEMPTMTVQENLRLPAVLLAPTTVPISPPPGPH
eukprot:5212339-Amphidinium_carterae.1